MKILQSLTVPGCLLILAPGQLKTEPRLNKRQIRGEWRTSLFKERVSGATILLKEAGRAPATWGIARPLSSSLQEDLVSSLIPAVGGR
jgi:hypothetical protein